MRHKSCCRLLNSSNLLCHNFIAVPFADDMGGGRKTLKAKKKVTFGFRKNKSYGYFINPLYKQSHDKMKKNEKR